MRIVPLSVTLEDKLDGMEILKKIERMGRTCYKSEDKITDDSATKFVRQRLDEKHVSVIEHVSVTVRIICNRGLSHEIVRHRIGSYSQESTRYCNYNKASEITVIKPTGLTTQQETIWSLAMTAAQERYLDLIDLGCSPQVARGVLPIDLKTEICVTYNLRTWRWFFT